MQPPYRVGTGRDVHGLVEGHALVLGGVHVPSSVGFATHSDGDVLSHALVDALAGAIADGDLGTHFPEDDPEAQDARSLDFLPYMVRLVRAREWSRWHTGPPRSVTLGRRGSFAALAGLNLIA